MRYYLTLIAITAILMIPWMMTMHPVATDHFLAVAHEVEDQLAALFFSHKPKTVAEIQARYTPLSPRKVRVLVVPGHEPGYGGAEYGTLKEREMNVELSNNLATFLQNNGRYEVFISRTNEVWSPEFESYFKNFWNDIINWQQEAIKETRYLRSVGQYQQVVPQVSHNDIAPAPGVRLYGITKWANENDIDITIHIHFNDYPRRNARIPGDHSGFAIYVPERQLGNSTTTQIIAASVFKRLSRYTPSSDLPGEAEGIVEEPELIAIGVNNTSNAASMLIEYGYIYENQFTNPEVRSSAIGDLAFQTYLGLQDFFGSGNNVTRAYDTLMLPRTFNRQMSVDGGRPEDVFALQTALMLEGVYPPKDLDKNACPRTGKFGTCTTAALAAFQKKYAITDEFGVVGARTLNTLNQLYSSRATTTP